MNACLLQASVLNINNCVFFSRRTKFISWRFPSFFHKVFLLESQLEEELEQSDDEFPTKENEDQRTFFFAISSSDSQEGAESTTRYIFKSIGAENFLLSKFFNGKVGVATRAIHKSLLAMFFIHSNLRKHLKSF